MNVFLVIALHVLSFAALVVVTAAALCVGAIVVCKALDISRDALSAMRSRDVYRVTAEKSMGRWSAAVDEYTSGMTEQCDCNQSKADYAPALRELRFAAEEKEGQSPPSGASESTATSGR